MSGRWWEPKQQRVVALNSEGWEGLLLLLLWTTTVVIREEEEEDMVEGGERLRELSLWAFSPFFIEVQRGEGSVKKQIKRE